MEGNTKVNYPAQNHDHDNQNAPHIWGSQHSTERIPSVIPPKQLTTTELILQNQYKNTATSFKNWTTINKE
jgi:hypothetical protein